jgi:hypothetical protein
MISLDKEPSKTFELVVAVRNSKGEDTGKRASYSSDSAYKIWEYWAKTVGNVRTYTKTTKLPTATEAQKILANMYN